MLIFVVPENWDLKKDCPSLDSPSPAGIWMPCCLFLTLETPGPRWWGYNNSKVIGPSPSFAGWGKRGPGGAQVCITD